MRYDVFVSHNWQDKPWVRRLVAFLRSQGLKIFFDEDSIPYGEDITLAIEQGIQSSRRIMLVITAPSMKSKWVALEYSLSIYTDPDAGERFIVPLLLEDVPRENIRPSLRRLNMVDLTQPDSREFALRKLLEELGVAAPISMPSVLLSIQEGLVGEARRPLLKTTPPDITTNGESSFNYASLKLGARGNALLRETLVREAANQLRRSSAPIVILLGLPGSGKTTLLFQVANELRVEFPYALTMVLGAREAIESAYILQEINNFLVLVGRELSHEALRSQSEQQVFDILASRLIDLNLLILVDGLDAVPSVWQRSILRGFGALPRARVLATAQNRPADISRVYTIAVPPLSKSEAHHVVDEYATTFGIEIDSRAVVDRLPAAVWSHPQSLTVFLSSLRDFPPSFVFNEDISRDRHISSKLVQQVIHCLRPEERAALSLLVVVSDLDLADTMREIPLSTPSDFLISIQTLLSRSLILRKGPAYLVPPIVAGAMWVVDPKFVNALIEQVVSFCQELRHGTAQNLGRVRALAAVVTQAAVDLRQREQWQLMSQLTEDFFLDLLNNRGYWIEYSVLVTLGIEYARWARDWTLYARLSFRLVRKRLQTRDLAAAHLALVELEQVLGTVGETGDHAELQSHCALLADMEGNEVAALNQLAEARRIWTLLGDEIGISSIERLIGALHLRHGRYTEARSSFEAALAGASRNPQSKPAIEAQTSLALCDLEAGAVETAEARLQSAISSCRLSGYEAGLPRAQLNLALVLERRAEIQEAYRLALSATRGARLTDPAVFRAANMIASRLGAVLCIEERNDGPEAKEI